MIRFSRGLMAMMAGISILPVMQAGAQNRTAETVFVMSNNVNKNEVIAFSRSGDGSFVEQRHYDTLGRGSGGVVDPLGSQGALTLSTDHSLLFAVNAGSGELTVFHVVRGGGLFFADKEPTGSEPVAVAQWQNLVYVLNAGGPGSVVGFHLSPEGRLQPIENSTAFLSDSTTGGASITISPNGKFLAVTERLANDIDIFQIHPDGTLAPIVVNSSPGAGAFAALFASDGNLMVSETGPAGSNDASAISSYSVLSNGMLSAVSQSVPTNGNLNCWNAISPDGKHIYVSNSGSSSIAGFTIGNGGALTPISGTVVATNPQGSTNLDIAMSSDGKYLYSLNSGTGTIGVFGVQPDGTLEELDQVQGLPAKAGFNGIAAL